MKTILNFQSPTFFKKLIDGYLNNSVDNFYNYYNCSNSYCNSTIKSKNSRNENDKNSNNKKNKLIRSESCQNLFQQKI